MNSKIFFAYIREVIDEILKDSGFPQKLHRLTFLLCPNEHCVFICFFIYIVFVRGRTQGCAD